jgi:UDP-N-acetylmuramate dehydrogenase
MSAMQNMKPINAIRGKLVANEPMTRYTSWRVGGMADTLFVPEDLLDLQTYLQTVDAQTPIYFVGLGSNLLVRDGGFRGTIIVMHNVLKDMVREGDEIFVEAGVTGAKLAKFCAKENKPGAEFFAGIPGTVGGALAMNAGCYGTETWEVVSRVTMINRAGELTVRDADTFKASYRHVEKPVEEEWFINAWIKLADGDGEASAKKIKELLAKRLATQPLNQPNAGSTFRNPEGDYAARLIETSGLKGYVMGGAQVSEKHANFIVNIGGANALDIELIIKHMQQTVQEKFGVTLQQEVKMIGEYAA